MSEFGRLDIRVDHRLKVLRQCTEQVRSERDFVDRVMFAVNGQTMPFSWLGKQATRRSLVVCGTLVALSLGWAAQAQDTAAAALMVNNLPMDTPW
jgi:hypothetical protein